MMGKDPMWLEIVFICKVFRSIREILIYLPFITYSVLISPPLCHSSYSWYVNIFSEQDTGWLPHELSQGPGWLQELHLVHLNSRQTAREKVRGHVLLKNFSENSLYLSPPPSVPNLATETSMAPNPRHSVLSFPITMQHPWIWGSVTSRIHWRKFMAE